LNRNGGSTSLFDAFSSREPVSTPHQVRGRLSLENALGSFTFPTGIALHCDIRSSSILSEQWRPPQPEQGTGPDHLANHAHEEAAI
jgi:hypothetical protein